MYLLKESLHSEIISKSLKFFIKDNLIIPILNFQIYSIYKKLKNKIKISNQKKLFINILFN